MFTRQTEKHSSRMCTALLPAVCATVFTVVCSLSVEEKKEKTLNNIISAKTKIRYEISELNERLKKSKEEIAKFKDEIGKLEGGGEYVDL